MTMIKISTFAIAYALIAASSITAVPSSSASLATRQANNAAPANPGVGAKGLTNTVPTSAADAQKSQCLFNNIIQDGSNQDGTKGIGAEKAAVASLTSPNNFINFCADSKLPPTNGLQVKGGSCNSIVMGEIPPTNKIPSAKFVFPQTNTNIDANKAFTVQLAINNLETGAFTNAQQNYYSAPQKLNAQQTIIGHSHIVIEDVGKDFLQTTPLDPTAFKFFLGLNTPAQNGILTADVTKGLPAGCYRVGSINTDANHAPALAPIAQHGILDDAVYFAVGGNNCLGANNAAAGQANAAAGQANAAAGQANAAANAAGNDAQANAGKAAAGQANAGKAAADAAAAKANAGKGAQANAGKGAQANAGKAAADAKANAAKAAADAKANAAKAAADAKANAAKAGAAAKANAGKNAAQQKQAQQNNQQKPPGKP